jgi:hypothetical protein
MYIKLTNGKPENYSIGQLHRDNPQTSFPKNPSDELLAEWGMYPVTELPRPSYNEHTHYLKASDFYQAEGKWQMHYSAEPLPQAQVTQTMRAERDRLLSESDWVVAKAYEIQNPVPDEWANYRQKLRDAPTQQGFPYNIIWPTKPTDLPGQTRG